MGEGKDTAPPERGERQVALAVGQMLAAVPAGGGWAHLPLAFPVSLFNVMREATDGSLEILSMSWLWFFSPALTVRCVGGTWGTWLVTSPRHCHQGQYLTQRDRPSQFLLQTLCCPPVDMRKSYTSLQLQAERMPSQGLPGNAKYETIKTRDSREAHFSLADRKRPEEMCQIGCVVHIDAFFIPSQGGTLDAY